MTTPDPPRHRWPEHQQWAKAVPGYRWHRRWGDRGADVVRRDGGSSWPVKLYRLDSERHPVGEPRLVGVYGSETQAKFVADVELGVPGIDGLARRSGTV